MGCLTATSADGCCPRWITRVVVGPSEGIVESVDGLALEAEPHVGVDANVGVSEEFFDHHEVDALLQEQGGGRRG